MTRVVASAHDFERETGRQAWIISGFRTAQEQADLDRRGRPTARDDLSTHRSCPATGVDVQLGTVPFHPTNEIKQIWGRIVMVNGLRWGGGSQLENGVPIDFNHVDRGPRR